MKEVQERVVGLGKRQNKILDKQIFETTFCLKITENQTIVLVLHHENQAKLKVLLNWLPATIIELKMHVLCPSFSLKW